jgi:putative inorganic carbon (HCO3(-)) transporter
MKSGSVDKLNRIGVLIAVLLPLLSGAIIAIIDNHFVILSLGTYISGFTAILFFMINALRGDISIKKNPAFWAIAALAFLALVSYYSVFLNPYEGLQKAIHGDFTPLVGEYGRYEGLLVLLCYFGIFLLAMCVRDEATPKKAAIAIVIGGAVVSLFAVLQHIPGLGFPNAYRDLPTFAYKNVYLSFGAADSPIFYGAFVTMIFAFCAGLAVFTEKHRYVFGALALLSFTTGLFTSSITPLIGCAAAALIIIVLSLILKRGRRFALGIFLAAGIIFTIVFLTQGIWVRDMYIARFDGFYRKFIVGSTVFDDKNLYQNAWGAAVNMIKNFPLFGVGPDSFAAYQNLKVQTYDSAYNEYLFTAATRGILSALIYIALLITAVIRLMKNIKNKYAPVLLAVISAYVIQAFFNTSAVTVAPLFWLILGFSFSKLISAETKKEEAIITPAIKNKTADNKNTAIKNKTVDNKSSAIKSKTVNNKNTANKNKTADNKNTSNRKKDKRRR